MTDDLITWIEQRIDADTTLDDEVGLLILAALEGDAELDEYLSNGTAPERETADDSGNDTAPATGAFLRSVTVAGFRGIGAPATVSLEPAPGLTVVAGRNGSGKSSLAEGLELLLTGGTYRWKSKKSTQWEDQWRNLHKPDPTQIDVEMVEEGRGPVRLRTTWPAGAGVREHSTTAQRTVNGLKGPQEAFSTLGWASALETFRPLLSYDELGGLLEAGRSELYDALAKVLGTEQLAEGLARIKARYAVLSAPMRAAVTERKALQTETAALPDERAQAIAPLLKKTAPDTAAIRELATGITLPDHGVVASLRALGQLVAPDPERVASAVARLRNARDAMVDAGEVELAQRMARLDLRRRALRLHAEHGQQPCPVCRSSTLDDAWAAASRDLVARDEKELSALSDAQAELEAARQVVRALVQKRPAATDQVPVVELEERVAAAREAWTAYETVPSDDLTLIERLPSLAEALAESVAVLRGVATEALAARDDAWAPLAARVAGWCENWDAAIADKAASDRLAAAEKWLKDNDTRLKNERIAPISKKARHAWSVLRQESNVDLGDLRLEGSNTRRRVEIPATVDGVEAGGALPVMSQGELHALTLALFLPRASLDASPFRFVVLDDPVQAMDPAKVDGLVALLSELAKTRQVVVFSHDDRLPAAVRRSGASARVLEVVRGADSTVTVSAADDPAIRYLADADALCLDKGVPDETLRRTLPGLVRMAVESAARDRFFAHRITLGESLPSVEETWNGVHKTSDRLSLAVHDEVRPLDDWLRTESRRKGLGVATSGFHKSLLAGTDPRDAVYHARRMVDDVRTGAK